IAAFMKQLLEVSMLIIFLMTLSLLTSCGGDNLTGGEAFLVFEDTTETQSEDLVDEAEQIVNNFPEDEVEAQEIIENIITKTNIQPFIKNIKIDLIKERSSFNATISEHELGDDQQV